MTDEWEQHDDRRSSAVTGYCGALSSIASTTSGKLPDDSQAAAVDVGTPIYDATIAALAAEPVWPTEAEADEAARQAHQQQPPASDTG